MQVIIYQTNAFTDVPFGGKSVAIIPDATDLSEQDVKNIIRVLKLEKTVFIYRQSENKFRLRFFREVQERKFCASSIISAFYTLSEKGYIDNVEKGVIRVYAETDIEVTPIDIYFEDWKVKRVEMTKGSPTLLQIIEDKNIISNMLNLNEEDIGIKDYDVYPELVYTGTQDIIIPVKSEEVLMKAKINNIKAKELLKKLNINLYEYPRINLFYFKDDVIIESRQFEVQEYNIVEKSCTGTENAGMVFFLKRNDIIGVKKCLCFKGRYDERPSMVFCEITDFKIDCPIKVGGMGKIFYEGILSL
ncbi:MAG: PhzF family phenazine biosynthesis isomerase [Andreesenia angusta]|nr:PhzF family phenazine biosynthesis isomerase [Andreesenia angusta]